MPPPCDCVYRAVPTRQLRIVPLDDLTLLYHRASGITHVLAMPALEIIEALGEQPMTAADLLAALGIDFDLAQGDLAALEARLAELVSAGLVIRE